MHACEYGCDTPYEELVVSIEEVTRAIEKLDLNKACGSDGICSEHLKYASNVLVPLLAMCFTSFISHGFLPETMLSVMLVPVIKDKAGKISSKDNYRPIALASVISKLVEVIMLDRIEMYMITNHNQFGFKRKHSTDQCIYVIIIIIIRQPLCPVVGRRPQHAVSKLPCLVLSSAISCRSSICPGRLSIAWLVSLVVFSYHMVSNW